MATHTPDGLIMYPQEGVGLVVSAAEHLFALAKWEAEIVRLRGLLTEALTDAEDQANWAKEYLDQLTAANARLARADFLTTEQQSTAENALNKCQLENGNTTVRPVDGNGSESEAKCEYQRKMAVKCFDELRPDADAPAVVTSDWLAL